MHYIVKKPTVMVSHRISPERYTTLREMAAATGKRQCGILNEALDADFRWHGFVRKEEAPDAKQD